MSIFYPLQRPYRLSKGVCLAVSTPTQAAFAFASTADAAFNFVACMVEWASDADCSCSRIQGWFLYPRRSIIAVRADPFPAVLPQGVGQSAAVWEHL
mmetsp:Transcript_138143/g.275412  ORF Transcript_138143/g.275412 Transcript_138143/m.275412 type:complete len:97 (+) Transcript_138143:17-307(+)